MSQILIQNLRLGGCCALGLFISVYGYYVEIMTEFQPNYQAMCDISEQISCTKVFATEYGRGFGVVAHLLGKDSILNLPNGLYGVLFYALSTLLAFTQCRRLATLHLWLTVVSNCLTIYLAYLLIFVIESLCVVCVSLYIVNAMILLICLKKKRILDEQSLKQD